ncbi:MAG: glycoside hydrolase family 127 protein [Anaerolineales bacterium]|nr:glycoside hydrolase family 127 protein [Anaerolineales bacterium]
MKFVPASCIKLDDPLWSKQFDLVRNVVLPHMWEILNGRVENAEKSRCIENFKIAAGLSNAQYYGPVFGDSDLYKWLEAVSYCLALDNDPRLNDLCDQVIDLIEAAQQPDGYLNTYFTVVAPEKRWTNLMEGHELYCAGHLMEAAVAHYQATRKVKLLDVACRFADLIHSIFGTDKRRGYPGHPEIELALIRLYEVTCKERYLSLAGYFINERGVGKNIFEEERQQDGHAYIFPEMEHFKADYFQSHLPVREQLRVTGHAVRAMYLFSGMADFARLTNDPALIEACKRLYENTVSRQMYVTGGVGSACSGERFTVDFDLPSDSAYAESCASIGLMLFSSRMWLLDPRKSYYDVWEQVLHNNVLSGMGRDGKHFFYVNPLEVVPQTVSSNPMLSHVKTQRQKWFGVACCPPNLARILTSMCGYIYALDNDRLYILSHIGSSFEQGGLYVKLCHDGDTYTLMVDGGPTDVFLRLPENSELIGDQFGNPSNGYFSLHHAGGKRQYSYSLKPVIRLLRAHPSVSALTGKTCVQRGQTIYCVEGSDNEVPLSALRLPVDAVFTEEKADWLQEDLPILKTTGYSVSDLNWEKKLYDSQPCVYEPREITFIPYSHWGNRGENEMRVWLTEKQAKSNIQESE